MGTDQRWWWRENAGDASLDCWWMAKRIRILIKFCSVGKDKENRISVKRIVHKQAKPFFINRNCWNAHLQYSFFRKTVFGRSTGTLLARCFYLTESNATDRVSHSLSPRPGMDRARINAMQMLGIVSSRSSHRGGRRRHETVHRRFF